MSIVKGHVVDPSGSFLGGEEFRAELYFRHANQAADLELKQTGSVAAAPTGDASYEFSYELLNEETFVGIQVWIVGVYNGESVTRKSPIIFDPSDMERVDVVVGSTEEDTVVRGPSEVTRIKDALGKLGIDLAEDLPDLPDETLQLIAARSGLSPHLLALYRRAAKLAEALEAATGPSVDVDLLYALGREKFAMSLLALALRSAAQRDEGFTSAITRNVINEAATADVATLSTALEDYVRAHGVSKLNDVISATLVADELGSSAAEDVVGMSRDAADPAEFWSTLRASVPKAAADELELALQLSAMTLENTPLVADLIARRRADEWTTMGQLAGETLAYWTARVDVFELPDGYDEAAVYAADIRHRFEEVVPTAAALRRLARSDALNGTLRDDLVSFCDTTEQNHQNHPTVQSPFELQTRCVEDFLEAHPLAGLTPPLADEDGTRTALKRIERLFRISPITDRSAVIEVLYAAGIASAMDVVSVGEERFVETHTDALEQAGIADGAAAAREVYRRAQQAAALASTVLARHGAGFTTKGFTVVGEQPTAVAGIVGYDNLFGVSSSCSCAHCRSIFGPAAYYADLLSFLDGRGLRAALDARRPDLVEIDLDCDNAHVGVPTIDLVNEVLETRVVEADLQTVPSEQYERQTTGTSEQRRAEPEHYYQTAYDVLAQETSGYQLPYDRFDAELTAFIEHCGGSRAAISDACAKDAGQRLIAAQQYMGLRSSADAAIFVASPSQAAIEARWGATLTELQQLPVLLRLAGMTYTELQDVVALPSFQPQVQVTFATLGDLETASVSINVSDADLLDRLLRLNLRSGWSFRDLEAAYRLIPGSLDVNEGPTLGQIEALHRELRVEREALINWIANTLDTERAGQATSFAERTFPRGVPTGTTFGEVATQLASDLGIKATEVLELAEGNVTDAALSTLCREVGLCAALDTSIDDYRALKTLLPSNPLGGAADIRAFVGEVRTLRQSKIGTNAARYLLCDETLDELGVPATETLEALLQDLHAQLREEVTFTNMVGVQAQGTTLAHVGGSATWNAGACSEEAINSGDAVEFRAGADNIYLMAGLSRHDQGQHYVTIDFALYLYGDGAVRVFEQGDYKGSFGSYQVGDRLRVEYSESGDVGYYHNGVLVYTSETKATGSYVFDTSFYGTGASLTHIRINRREKASNRDVVAAALAEFASVEEGNADDLADVITLGGGAVSFRTALEDELEHEDVEGGIPENYIAAAKRFAKAGRLVTWSQLPPSDWGILASLSVNGGPFINAVPTEATSDPSAPLRQAFAAFCAAVAVRRRFVEPDDELLHDLGDAFATNAGLDPADVTSIRGWLDVGQDASIGDLVDVIAVVDALAPLGLTAETFNLQQGQANSFLFGGASADDVSSVLGAARAEQASEAWYAAITPLRDRLRREARDALVTYLVQSDQTSYEDANDIYGDLLIDIEMEPCQTLTRLKAAIGSVQQYIQRVFLRLESGNLTEEDARLWEWMKSYRIWEANRKVFVYPENWLEPSLRDDKTPFFRELEAELAQGEVTNERVEEAVINYLEKLDEVSRLDIRAIYNEVHDDGNTLHVVGRTVASPRRYFYRCRHNGLWQPWEPLDVDLEGEHLILMAAHRRLYLFWPMFGDGTVSKIPDVPASGTGQVGEQPKRFYTLRLGWCERRNGRWGRRKLSSLEIKPTNESQATEPFFLKNDVATESSYYLYGTVDHETGDILVAPARRATDGWMVQAMLGTLKSDPSVRHWMHERFRLSMASGAVTVEASDKDEIVRDWAGRSRRAQHVTAGAGTAFALSTLDLARGDHELAAILKQVPRDYTLLGPAFAVAPSGDTLPLVYRDDCHTFLIEGDARHLARVAPPPWAQSNQVPPSTGATIPSLWKQQAESRLEADPWSHDPDAIITTHDGAQVVLPVADAGSLDFPAGGLIGAIKRGLRQSFGQRLSVLAGAAPLPQSNNIAALPQLELVNGDASVLVRAGGTPAPGGHSITIGSQSVSIPTVATRERLTGPVQGSVDESVTQVEVIDFQRYRFTSLIHPYTQVFRQAVNVGGIWALYRPTQTDSPLYRQQAADVSFFGTEYYSPSTGRVLQPYPKDEIDFTVGSPYGIYNWEVFVHIPQLVADKLRLDGRFAEARRWLHTIFDPTVGGTSGEGAERYWRVAPFYDMVSDPAQAMPIKDTLALLAPSEGTDATALGRRQAMLAQIEAWLDDPFSPHAIARMRISAYQQAVLCSYLDVLIEWGDMLFRRDTIESINEATQLYVLAAELLGKRPEQLPGVAPEARSYSELSIADDGFANALVEVEGRLPEVDGSWQLRELPMPLSKNQMVTAEKSGGEQVLYFCVPPNDRLLTNYWDRVSDRLFKIRHCQNIDGKTRALAIWEPPIDPALLVRAKAMGLDLATVIHNLNQPLPPYRFERMIATARSFCQEVQALEGALLSAIEKRDAEELSRLRAVHQVNLDKAMEGVRKAQVDEAKSKLAALQKSRAATMARLRHYANLPKLLEDEKQQHRQLAKASDDHNTAADIETMLQMLSAYEELVSGTAGAGGSPLVYLTALMKLAKGGLTVAAKIKREGASRHDRSAYRAGLRSAQAWREIDRNFKVEDITKELTTLEEKILTAEIGVAIADRSLENHRKGVEQAKEVSDFYEQKFSNRELYHWMVGSLCTLHYQGYELALQLARRAERCLQFELAKPTAFYVRSQGMGGLRSRLLAGQELAHDLRQMEAIFLEENKRQHEITRHISLGELDPIALIRLRETGECWFKLPKELFDVDIPNHHLRRIKSVALSIPSVVGPYTPVHGRLNLEWHEINSGSQTISLPGLSSTTVVTSGAQMDTGLFEASFNDPRYLPFEGAGAISEWYLKLADVAQFDYRSISDVVMHLRYTAQDGGSGVGAASSLLNTTMAVSSETTPLTGRTAFMELVDVATSFPEAWTSFLAQEPSGEAPVAGFTLTEEHLPVWAVNATLEKVWLLVELDSGSYANNGSFSVDAPASSDSGALASLAFGGKVAGKDLTLTGNVLGEWSVTCTASGDLAGTGSRVDPAKVRGMKLVIAYNVS
jgi:hypothetical protein